VAKSIGQNGMINSCQVWWNHFFKYVSPGGLVRR